MTPRLLYLFDLDGTLITSYMEDEHKRYGRWRVLADRREALSEIRAAGCRAGIVTNQAGVAFGYVTETEARVKVSAAVSLLGLPPATPIAMCFHHPNGQAPYNAEAGCARRKPSGAMIKELAASTYTRLVNVIFVGDMDSDREAAEDAGVRYFDAAEFFGAPAVPLLPRPVAGHPRTTRRVPHL